MRTADIIAQLRDAIARLEETAPRLDPLLERGGQYIIGVTYRSTRSSEPMGGRFLHQLEVSFHDGPLDLVTEAGAVVSDWYGGQRHASLDLGAVVVVGYQRREPEPEPAYLRRDRERNEALGEAIARSYDARKP